MSHWEYDECVLKVLNYYEECDRCNASRKNSCYMSTHALREQLRLFAPTKHGEDLEEAIACARGEMHLC